MKIGVPKEIKPQESRIGLTPDSVKVLASNGHKVLIETNAGYEAGFDNEQYVNAGAQIVEKAEDVFNDAEIIVKVKEPLINEIKMIRENQIVFTYLHLAAARELTEELMVAKKISNIVHLDVVDGIFAPSKVLQFPFKLKRGLEYSAHLMINKPIPFIKKHKHRVQLFIPHFEVFKNPQSYIQFCRKEKIISSFALLPKTSFTKIKPYLKELDFILALTVRPGFYGSKFQKSQMQKIKRIKEYIKKQKLQTKIIVDGGMNPVHIKLAKKAGADIFISGSYVMKTEDPKKAMTTLKKAISKTKSKEK